MPVKKAKQATPNFLLRRARLERGWSQQYVADQVDAPQSFMISRWEQGTATPGPLYRQKLCELFDKSAIELGFLKEEALPPTLVDSHAIYDPTISHPLSLSSGLVGRDVILTELKTTLCRSEHPLYIALDGLPGVGKTALVAALAHDEQIKQQFCDGILWAGLGRQANLVAHLRRWGKLLGITEREISKYHSLDALAKAIRFAIGTRHLVLIIDDAWKLEDAWVLRVGGPNCSHLLTTRFSDIAICFAGEHALQVQELSTDDGIELLRRLAPAVVEQQWKESQSLVLAVGGLPLALLLMGRYLLTQTRHQQQRRLQAALARLYCAETRLSIEQLPEDFE